MTGKTEKRQSESRAIEPPAARTEDVYTPPMGAPIDTLLRYQRTVGNQAVLRLLHQGTIQTKLRISQPGDAAELEADRVAEKITASGQGEVLQRKCACGGDSPCAKCTDEEELIQRSATDPLIASPLSTIARSPAAVSAGPLIQAAPAPGSGLAPGDDSLGMLIVDDGAPALASGQMRKSEFLAELRSGVCATTDDALASVGRSSKNCPYLERWLAFYAAQGSAHIERAVRRYASGAAAATRAEEYLPIINDRVRQAAITWARTGQVAGMPPGVDFMPQGSGSGEGEQLSSPPMDGLSASHTVPPTLPSEGIANVLTKRQDGGSDHSTEAETVRNRLGAGRALDNPVMSRMESAFGRDFSGVRLHTDANAAALSTEIHARAFTIGEHVAFASGEYQPGTMVGDALIAHELAHVVQQGSARESATPSLKGGGEYNALEADADWSAIGAVAALWTGVRGKLADIGRSAMPRLKSGLKLQRCQAAPLLLETGEVIEEGAVIEGSTTAIETGPALRLVPPVEPIPIEPPVPIAPAPPVPVEPVPPVPAPAPVPTPVPTPTPAPTPGGGIGTIGKIVGIGGATQLTDQTTPGQDTAKKPVPQPVPVPQPKEQPRRRRKECDEEEVTGGHVPPSAFDFKRFTQEPIHSQGCCVNLRLPSGDTFRPCPLMITYPEAHYRGRNPGPGAAQATASSAANACSQELCDTGKLTCIALANCMQEAMVDAGFIGARVQVGCKIPVTASDWPAVH